MVNDEYTWWKELQTMRDHLRYAEEQIQRMGQLLPSGGANEMGAIKIHIQHLEGMMKNPLKTKESEENRTIVDDDGRREGSTFKDALQDLFQRIPITIEYHGTRSVQQSLLYLLSSVVPHRSIVCVMTT